MFVNIVKTRFVGQTHEATKTVIQIVPKTHLLNQCAIKSEYVRLFGRMM